MAMAPMGIFGPNAAGRASGSEPLDSFRLLHHQREDQRNPGKATRHDPTLAIPVVLQHGEGLPVADVMLSQGPDGQACVDEDPGHLLEVMCPVVVGRVCDSGARGVGFPDDASCPFFLAVILSHRVGLVGLVGDFGPAEPTLRDGQAVIVQGEKEGVGVPDHEDASRCQEGGDGLRPLLEVWQPGDGADRCDDQVEEALLVGHGLGGETGITFDVGDGGVGAGGQLTGVVEGGGGEVQPVDLPGPQPPPGQGVITYGGTGGGGGGVPAPCGRAGGP